MAKQITFPAYLGVYSLRKYRQIGSGATMVDHRNTTFWYVRQLDAATFEVQPLSASGLPSGVLSMTGLSEFITTYTPEPFYYSEHKVPVVDSMAAKIMDGDDSTSLGTLDKKEFAVLQSFMVEKMSLADHSKPGYEVAHKRLIDSVKKVLSVITCRNEAIRFEHRSRLNNFGVTLRKDGRFDESINYFTKALELEGNDENVHFNMARVYYDMGDMEGCGKALQQALSINPHFNEADRFVRHIRGRGATLP